MDSIPQLNYSIDELALYLAGLDPYVVNSVDIALGENWTGCIEAKKWRTCIVQHLAQKRLLLKEDAYVLTEQYFHDLEGGVVDKSYSPFSLLMEELEGVAPSYNKRFISIDNLVKWANEFSIKLWFEYTSPSSATDTTNKQTPQELVDRTNIPQDLLEIQKLLDGNHEFQAPELNTALRVWLAAIDDPQVNKHNAKKRIESHIPQDITANAARERLAKVCNWNKEGNR
jgi:hypothetical protein